MGPLVKLYRVNAGAILNDNWPQYAESSDHIVAEMQHFGDALTCFAGVHAVGSVRGRWHYAAR